MNNGKRLLMTLFCVLLIAMVITSCGSSSEEGEKEIVSSEGKQETDTEQEMESEEEPEASTVAISIEEQVLVDQDGVKITATEYVTDNIWGDGVKILIENNAETDMTIGCDALIVNDYMLTDLFACEVASGKKANETVYLSSAELKAAGIESVGKIEIYFHAYNPDYDTIFGKVYSEIQTSDYENMDTTPDDTGHELYNENGIRIVGKTVDENSFWGTAILLYIENTSGQDVGISVDNMSINGFMVEPYFSTTVYNEKKAINDITIFEEDLTTNGIESVDEVELKFHIYNEETYDTIADSDAITFSAQ